MTLCALIANIFLKALFNLIESRMPFTTSGQETEWAYSYNPRVHTGLNVSKLHINERQSNTKFLQCTRNIKHVSQGIAQTSYKLILKNNYHK